MRIKYFILIFIFSNRLIAFSQERDLKLWYRQPANALVTDSKEGFIDDAEWLKALPLGNGNIGAMVFGDVPVERVQLNEKTLWSGSNNDNDNPDAPKYIARIRKLLFEGKFREATELTNQTQICKGVGSGNGSGANVPFGCFQTLGDLWLDFGNGKEFTNYRRELDLSTAVATVTYTRNNIRYKREYFVSAPANALVIRITANRKAAVNCTVRLNRPERFQTKAKGTRLVMSGTLDNGKGGQGMAYMARLAAKQKGGKKINLDGQLIITGADELLIFLTASTDYLPQYPVYKGRDYAKITRENLDKATDTDYAQLRKSHINDYRRYFNRVSLELAGPANSEDLPTDERLQRFANTRNDNYLTQLYFQYSRYLLISSARPNTLPANLQGIWANKIQTPWNGDYHTDINVQMNYWLAENTNLSELHLSLTRFIQSIEKPATRSAAVQFGLQGWCINPIVNVWGFTSPGEQPSWGLTSGASGWVAQHLWEHYRFTLDTAYLKDIYPTLKNAARFYLGWLVTDPETGKLISGPAASPENSFVAPDSSNGTISMGPSHDQQIIAELFGNVLLAANILKDHDTLVSQLRVAKDRLLPTQIGPDGRILEWAKSYPEQEPGHRHLSHLYALYPGYAFNRAETPEFVIAAKKSLQYRLQHGGGHTGWSAAWVTNLWARLKEGDEALNAFNAILEKRTAPNLFDLHPPFQIDGNFGAAAGLAEMLLQSHEGCLELLPAIPSAWKNGEVKGLCGRGGFVVDMKWREGKLLSAKVFSKWGGNCKVRFAGREVNVKSKPGATYNFSGELLLVQK
ncbi:glycoside hydrolase family 95 protein [Flavihumibacter profundi]|uniref:glycoside hydrolase family 95 protein n=1 Tax=Flavihumibacter profundi TaxID=2716883 RepID=UPI001CC77086|nr:glycoside hydrolase family 95 protein [Flavihumibacter profundi]MBZ5859302.1 glycoside hydrolase family 95 protein [Flavihumibacter profundi]